MPVRGIVRLGATQGGRPTRSSSTSAKKGGNEHASTATAERAKSTSPRTKSTNHQVQVHNPFSQLSDAGPGASDETSLRDVENWFYLLEHEIQALLNPLRRGRGKRVKIAILDTGIDITHPDFADCTSGPNFSRRIKACEDVDPAGNAEDACGHGTHCVGLLRRVAPNADIYVAKVAGDFSSSISEEAVARAMLRTCRDGKDEQGVKYWGVDIISMSLGFYKHSNVVLSVLREALTKDKLIFAAASNNGTLKKVTFPASWPGVMRVNSAISHGTPSTFNSTLGPADFTALGENVKSSWIRDSASGKTNQGQRAEKIMSGTSMATPIAAGIAALVLEYVLQNDPEKYQLLKHWKDLKGPKGMPDVFALMSEFKDGCMNVVPWKVVTKTHPRERITSMIEEILSEFIN